MIFEERGVEAQLKSLLLKKRIKEESMIEVKDKIALLGIVATFLVALINLIYMVINSRKTVFVSTVTASRLKWIDSLRDKIAAFIAVTVRLLNPERAPNEPQTVSTLLRERDTLMHQIILHLNPGDPEDQAIQRFVEQVARLTSGGIYNDELQGLLVNLRNATQVYLKKEWTRVKQESKTGEQY